MVLSIMPMNLQGEQIMTSAHITDSVNITADLDDGRRLKFPHLGLVLHSFLIAIQLRSVYDLFIMFVCGPMKAVIVPLRAPGRC